MGVIVGKINYLYGGKFFIKDKEGNIKELAVGDIIHEDDIIFGDSENSFFSRIDILITGSDVIVVNQGEEQQIEKYLTKTLFGVDELFFTSRVSEQLVASNNELVDIDSKLRKSSWAITRTFNEAEKTQYLEGLVKKELGSSPENLFDPLPPIPTVSTILVRPSTDKPLSDENKNRPESEGARPLEPTPEERPEITPPTPFEIPAKLSIDDVTIYEQDGKLYFTVNLDKPLRGDVTFTYKTSSGTATEGVDYVGKTGTITIPGGSTSIQIPIDIIDDYLYEKSEYFNIEITDIEGNIIPLKTQAIATILDNPPAFNEILGDSTDSQTGSYGAEDTVFAIITGDNSVKEGYTSSYKVELIDKDGNPVNVKQDTEVTVVYKNISTQDNDTEYKNEDKLKFIIKAGFSNVTFTVETIDDFYADNGEEFKLELEFVNTNEFENISLGDINQKNKYVTTEILDNTTTNPNNPSTVEATQENVILKLVACDDSGNPIMDGDKYTFTNSVAEGSSSKYMVLAFAPNTTSFTTSTVLDTQYQGGTVTISTTDGSAVTTGNIDNATLDFEKQSSTSVTVGQFFEIYSIDDYLADNNETFTVNIDTSSYTHPSTPIYENITIDSEKITTTVFDNSTDSPTQDSNIESTQDSVIIKIVVANPDGTPKKDTNGNYLTQSDVTEGDSAYYVILAFKPDSNGVFNDSTKIADDKLFGSVEITTENIDAIGVSTQTFENGTQDYISFSNRVDLNTLITVKTLDDWKADNDEQFEIKIIDKSYDHPSSDIKYENITTDLNPVVTTIKDNTTTTPNIPSEIENSNNDNSAVEPVVLKIVALNQAGEIILKKDGAEDKFIANFDDLYNYENNIATLKEEYAGYSFADKNSVTEGSNSSYMVLAFAPNTTNFTTNTVLDTQYQGGTVTISTTDGSAVTTGNIDNATLDFEKQTSTSVTVGQSFSIKTIDDYLADNDETFTVNIDTSSYTHPNTDAIYENVVIDSSLIETTIKDNTTNTPNENSDVENTDNNNTSVDNVILKIVAVNSLGEPIDASGNKITDTTTSYVITSSVTEGDSAYYKVLAFKPDSNGVFNSSTKLADDKQVGSVEVKTFNKEAIGVTEQTLEDGTQDYISFANRVDLNTLITVKTLDDWRADNDEQFEIKITDKSYNHPSGDIKYENITTDLNPVVTTIKDNTRDDANNTTDNIVENSNNDNSAVEPVVLKLVACDDSGNPIIVDNKYTFTNSVAEGSNAFYMVLAFEPNTTNFTTSTVLDAQYQGGTVTISTTDGEGIKGAESDGTRFEATLDYEAKVVEATDGKTVTIGQAFQIKTLDDELADSEETFTVNIDNSSYIHPSTAIYENVTIKTESVTTTIYDNSTTMDGTPTNPNYPDTHNTEKDSSGNNDKEIITLRLFAVNRDLSGNITTYKESNYADEIPRDYEVEYIVLAFSQNDYDTYLSGGNNILTPNQVSVITSNIKQVGNVEIIFGQTGDTAIGGNYPDGSTTYPNYQPNSGNMGGNGNPDYDATKQTVKVGDIFNTTVFKDYKEDVKEFYTVKIEENSYKKDSNSEAYESVEIKLNTVQTNIREMIFAKIEKLSDGSDSVFEGSPLKYKITFVDEYGKTIALTENPTINLEYKGLNTDGKKPATLVDVNENDKKDFIQKTSVEIDINESKFIQDKFYTLDIETIRDIHIEGSEWLEIELKSIEYHGDFYIIVPHSPGHYSDYTSDFEDLTKVQGEIKDNDLLNTNEDNTVYAIITGTQTIIEGQTSTDYKVELLYKDGNPVKVTADTVVKILYSTDNHSLKADLIEDIESFKDITSISGNEITVTIPANTSSTTFKIDTKQDFWADNDEKFDLTITAIDGKVSGQATSKFEKVVFDNYYDGLTNPANPSNKVTTTIEDDSKPKTGDILPNPNDPTDGKVETDDAQQVILRIVALDQDGKVLFSDGSSIEISGLLDDNGNIIYSGDNKTFVFENSVTEGSDANYMVLAFDPQSGTDFTTNNLVSKQAGTVTIETAESTGDKKAVGVTSSDSYADDGTQDYIKDIKDATSNIVTLGQKFSITTLDDWKADDDEQYLVNIKPSSYNHPKDGATIKPLYENVKIDSGNVETTIKDNTRENPNESSTVESNQENVILKIVALNQDGQIILHNGTAYKYVNDFSYLHDENGVLNTDYTGYSFVFENSVSEGSDANYMVLAFKPTVNNEASTNAHFTTANVLSKQGGKVTIETTEATEDKKAVGVTSSGSYADDGTQDYISKKVEVELASKISVTTIDDWKADNAEQFNIKFTEDEYLHPTTGAIYENVVKNISPVTTTISDNTTETPNENSLIEPNQENVILKLVALDESGNILLKDSNGDIGTKPKGDLINIDGTVKDLGENYSFVFENEAREGATSKYMVFAFVPTAGSDFTVKNLTSVQGGTVTVNTIDNSGDAKQKTDLTVAKIDGTEDYIAKTQTGVVIGDTVFEVTILDDYLKDGGEKFQVEIKNNSYKHPNDGTVKPIYENVVTHTGKVETTIVDNPASITGTTVDGENKVDDGTTYGKEDTVYVKIINDAVVVEGGKLEHYIQLVDKDGNAVVIPDGEEIIVTLKYTIDNGDIKNADFKEANHQYNESTKELIVTLNSATEIDANGVYKLPIINETVIDENVEITEKYTLTITNVKQSVGKFENIAIGDVNGTNKSVTGTIHDNPVKIVLVAVTASDINENGTVKLENIDLSKTTNTAPEGGKLYYVAVAVDSVSNKPLLTQTGSVKVAYTTEDIIGNKAILENATNSDPKYPTDIKIYEETKETVSLGKVFIVDALDDYYADANEEFKVIISEPDATAQTTYKTFDVNNSSVDVTLGNTTVTSTIKDNPSKHNQSASGETTDSTAGNYGEEDTVWAIIEAVKVGETDVSDSKNITSIENDIITYRVKLVESDGITAVTVSSDTTVTIQFAGSGTSQADLDDLLNITDAKRTDVLTSAKNNAGEFTITIPANSDKTQFTIQTKPDIFDEGSESFDLTIQDIASTEFENLVFNRLKNQEVGSNKTTTEITDRIPDNKDEDNTVYIVIDENKTVLEGEDLVHTLQLVDKNGQNVKVPSDKTVTVTLKYTTSDNIIENDFSTNSNPDDRPVNDKTITVTLDTNGNAIIANKTVIDALVEGSETYTLTIESINDVNSVFEKTIIGDISGNGKSATGTITDNPVRVVLVAVDEDDAGKSWDTLKRDLKYVDSNGILIFNNTNETQESGTLYYIAVAVDKNNKPLDVQEGSVTVNYTASGSNHATLTGGTPTNPVDIKENPSTATIGTVFSVGTTDDFYAEGDEIFEVTISVPDTGENYKSTVSVDTLHNKVISTIKDNPANKDSNTVGNPTEDGGYEEIDTVYVIIKSENPTEVKEGEDLVYYLQLVDKDGGKVEIPAGETITVNLVYSSTNDVVDASDFEENKWTKKVELTSSTTYITDKGYKFTNTTKIDAKVEEAETYTLTIGNITQTVEKFENIQAGYSESFKAKEENKSLGAGTTVTGTINDNDVRIVLVAVSNPAHTTVAHLPKDGNGALILSGTNTAPEGGKLYYMAVAVDANNKPMDVQNGTVTVSYASSETNGATLTGGTVTNPLDIQTYTFTTTVGTKFYVDVKDDYYSEVDENFTVTISDPVTDEGKYKSTVKIDGNNIVTSTITDNPSKHNQSALEETTDSTAGNYGEEDTIWAVIEAVKLDEDGTTYSVITDPKPTEGESITYRVKLINSKGDAVTVSKNTTVTVKFAGENVNVNLSDISTINETNVSTSDNEYNFIIQIDKDNSETTFTIETKIDVLNEMKEIDEKKVGEKFDLTIDSIDLSEFENLVYNKLKDGGNNKVTTEIKDTTEPTQENTVYAIITGDDTVKEGSAATYTVSLIDKDGNQVFVPEDTEIKFKYENIKTNDDDTQYKNNEVFTVVIKQFASSAEFTVQTKQDYWADNNEDFKLTIYSVDGEVSGNKTAKFEKVIFSDYSGENSGYVGKNEDGLRLADLTNTVTTTIIDNSNPDSGGNYPNPNEAGTEEGSTQAVILKIVESYADGNPIMNGSNYIISNDIKEGNSAYYIVLAFKPNTTQFTTTNVLASDKQVGTVDIKTVDKISGLIAKGVAEQTLYDGNQDYIENSQTAIKIGGGSENVFQVVTLDDWRADNGEQFEIQIVENTYQHPKDSGENVTPVYENVTKGADFTVTIKDNTTSTPNAVSNTETNGMEKVILKIVAANQDGIAQFESDNKTYKFVNDVNEGDSAYYIVLAFKPNTEEFTTDNLLLIQDGTVQVSTKNITDGATGVGSKSKIDGTQDYISKSQEIKVGGGAGNVFEVVTIDDYKAEADETFEVTILDGSGNGTYKHPTTPVYENVKSEGNVKTTIKDNEAKYNETAAGTTVDNPASGSGNYGKEDTVWVKISQDTDNVVEGKEVTYTVQFVDKDNKPVIVTQDTTVTVQFEGLNENITLTDLSEIIVNGTDVLTSASENDGKFTITIPNTFSSATFTVTTLDDFTKEGASEDENGKEQFTLTITDVQDTKEFENLVWNDDTKNNSVTTTIKDGVTLGTPENTIVYEDGLHDDSDDSENSYTKSLGITNLNDDSYTVSFDKTFEDFTYEHNGTKYHFKSNDSELDYTYSEDGKTLTATRKDGDKAKVFTITLNEDKKTYTFELHQPMDHIIKHDNDTSFDIPFKFYVESDDTKSDSKEVKVTVVDSVPVATDIVETMNEDGGSIEIRLSNEAFKNGNIIIDGQTIAENGTANIYDNGQTSGNPIGTLKNNGNGIVTFTPKANYSNYDPDYSPKFSYSVTDFDGDTATGTVKININPVVDGVDLSGLTANGTEFTNNGTVGDEYIELKIGTDGLNLLPFIDNDGSEKVTQISLSGLPTGFTVYYGDYKTETTAKNIPVVNGKMPNIYIKAPAHYSGTVSGLKLSVTIEDVGATTVTETFEHSFTLNITAVASDITIVPLATIGDAFSWLELKLGAIMQDTDGSEKMSLELSGLSANSQFKIKDGDILTNALFDENQKTWTISDIEHNDINNIQFTSEKDVNNVTVKAWTVEDSNKNVSAIKTSSFEVDVNIPNSGELILSEGVNLDFSKLDKSELKNITSIDLGAGNGKNELLNLTLADVLAIGKEEDGKINLTILGGVTNQIDKDKISFASNNGWEKGQSESGFIIYSNTENDNIKVKVESSIDII